MKSTIRVDYAGLDNMQSGFQPVIRVHLQDSEDVRDSLLKTFFQSLGGESSWLKVEFHTDSIDNVPQPWQRITIFPIPSKDLQDTANEINERIVRE